MPKISVVLPTYNGSRYIKQSIESVISQTFTDWELIIVDDCSDDGTDTVVEEYVSRDERIKVVHNEVNQKLPRSLNIGFRTALGEYLTWTSDDNIYESNAFEELLNYLESHKDMPMVCSDMKILYEDGRVEKYVINYSNECLYVSNCVGACFMYRRNKALDVGEYDADLFLVEDYDYWFRFMIKYRTIGYLKKSLYIYRKHKESLTEIQQNKVKKQLCLFRQKHMTLYQRSDIKKDILCAVVLSCIEEGIDLDLVKKELSKQLPELEIISKPDDTKRKILYGAGQVGKETYNVLGDKVAYFADTNAEKVGKEINGIEILSVEDMVAKKEKYEIIISVDKYKTYELLNNLYKYRPIRCAVSL